MKAISPISVGSAIAARTVGSEGLKSSGHKFQDVLNRAGAGPGIDLYPQMVKLQSDMMSGKKFGPQELLGYQILVGQFSLRVEMLSKAAESASAAIKKFQSPQ